MNNLHLIRGMIGRPGCGVLQMNGQPTAAEHPRVRRATASCPPSATGTTRSTSPRLGAALERRAGDASPTGPRRRTRCRSSATPRRARSSSSGSSAPTRPSRCPSCAAIRKILAQEGLFVVVQDAFLTETAAAGRRRPAGGDLGREDRHASPTPTAPSTSRHKAVEPPGEARADLDIFLDFARRMDFRDKDGGPLDQVDRRRGGVRGLEGVLAGRPLRLQRA